MVMKYHPFLTLTTEVRGKHSNRSFHFPLLGLSFLKKAHGPLYNTGHKVVYWDWISLCGPGCPQTQDPASSPSQSWDSKHVPTVSSLALTLPSPSCPIHLTQKAEPTNITGYYSPVKANDLTFPFNMTRCQASVSSFGKVSMHGNKQRGASVTLQNLSFPVFSLCRRTAL